MDTSPLFAAKVRRPLPSGLSRTRLRNRLLADGVEVASVAAPAGAGKTTLLAEVAEAAAPRVGWYRAGPEDRSEASLARYLARALSTVLPGWEDVRRIDELLHPLERAGPVLLVLDDLHDIEGSSAERAVERLLDLRPPGLRVVLASRRPLTLNLPRLRVAGALVEVDGDDLRFRSWEVEQLFGTVYGEPLPPEAAAALSRRTGGWAAGLQLFHLATTGKDPDDRMRFLSSLSAQARLLRPYLARNVLAELSPARRHFLVRTAALGQLTGPLCDELLGTGGSEAVLRDLEQRQIFTAALDDGKTFRYHQVLRSHLDLALVEDLGPEAARAWQARAARVLEGAGVVGEALLAYARAEDWASVARLVQARGPDVAAEAGEAWEELLPPNVWRGDPWLAVAEAHRKIRQGALPEAVTALRIAEEMFGDSAATARAQLARRAVSAWVEAGEPQGLAVSSLHWAEVLRRQTRRVPTSTEPAAIDSLAAGLGHLVSGRFRDASATLEPLVSTAASADLRLVARVGATVANLVLGALPDPAGRFEDLALRAEVAGQPWLAGVASAIRSEVIDERTDLPARNHLTGDPWGAALGRLLHGLASIRRGRPEPMALDEARQRFDALNAPVLSVWASALQALGRAADGEPTAGEEAATTEAVARALGAPGPQAIALAALATAAPNGRAQYAERARRAAQECGLPLETLLPRPVQPAGSPPVSVCLFGGFAICVNGAPVSLSGLRPRARSLLRVLALSYGMPVHRERLVDTLWPGADLSAGLRSLHVALSSLRQALERAGLPAAALSRHDDAYSLAIPGADVDVRRHAAALSAGAAARADGDVLAAVASYRLAVDLYAGDLLPEDGPAEWVVPARERHRVATAAAAEALAAGYRALGRPEEAANAARRAVELDPFRDGAWRLRALVHEERGDPGAAARVRVDHARMMASIGLDVPTRAKVRVRPGPPRSGAGRERA